MDSKLIEAKGFDTLPAKEIEVPEQMDYIEVPGKKDENLYGIDELVDAVKFILALIQAYKESLKDGKISITDIPNLLQPTMLLLPFLKGLKNVPLELADEITEEEQALVINTIIEAGILPEKAESVAIEVIYLLVQIKAFIYKHFIQNN